MLRLFFRLLISYFLGILSVVFCLVLCSNEIAALGSRSYVVINVLSTHMGIMSVVGILWSLGCSLLVARGQRRRYAKMPAYLALQEYILELIDTTPELQFLGKVKLYISNDTEFQGKAVPPGYIIISKPWLYAASVDKTALEYAKCTICHELYHLSKHRHIEFTSVNILCILRFLKRFRDNACVASWVEELEADRNGCRWYGSREIFLQKMRKMEELYPEKKKRFSTHPTWTMRIRFIEEGIEPTPETVREMFEEYYYPNDR